MVGCKHVLSLYFGKIQAKNQTKGMVAEMICLNRSMPSIWRKKSWYVNENKINSSSIINIVRFERWEAVLL